MDRTEAGLRVEIRHVFEPRWPVPDALLQAIVGDYFVNGVARRTLRRIAELAEAQSDVARLASGGATKRA
jgi:hypothetical protein